MRTSPSWKPARWIPAIALLLAACSQPERIPPPVFLEPTTRPTIAVSTLASTQATTSSVADIIFHNGVILTMDDARPSATALSVQGEKIVSVGDDATVLAEAGPSTTVIDLSGRMLMPGFVDAHSHMFEQQNLGAVQDTLPRGGLTTSTDMYVDAPLLQRLQALDEAVLGGSTETVAAGGLPRGAIWLRLVRQGSTYTGSWSADGETWMPVGSTTANFTPRNVGLMATTSGSGAAPASAEFDFFQVRQP